MKVLLIDDDTLTHEVAALFLRRFGQEHQIEIDIKALHDSVQGLLELSSNGSAYDLILLDVRLPRLSGDEIYRSIAKNAPELIERVIFITASPQTLHSKLPDRDLRVLGKPFRYEAFEFHVDDLRQQRTAGQQAG